MATVETAVAGERATKPRLIFFTSSLSGQCRRVEGFLAQVLQRRRNHGTFRVLVVDEDERPDLVSRFGVTGAADARRRRGTNGARAARAATRLPRDRRAARPLAALTRAVSLRAVPGPNVPFPPMEAELVRELPAGDGWQYEPKWDGFRGVLENDGGELALWSRNERPLLRYFPELRPLGELLPPHSALDGEIVIARDGVLDFDSMQTRLHPAESRVQTARRRDPGDFVVFDLLLWNGKPIHAKPLEQRRAELLKRGEGFWLSPATTDLAAATALARPLRGDRARRRRREAARAPVPARLARGRRQGEGAQDRRLRRRRRPLEARAAGKLATLLLGLYRDDGEIDYVGSAAVGARNHDEIAGARPAAARRALRAPLLGAEPLGHRRARGDAAAARARRRGALRQGAGQPLPPRHEADPLPRRQGSRPSARGGRSGRRGGRTTPPSRRCSARLG